MSAVGRRNDSETAKVGFPWCRLTTACSRRPSQSSNLHAQICRLSGARLMLAVRRASMPSRIITREEIARMLSDWANGGVSAQDVFGWAGTLYPSDELECADWENDQNSVSNEVLAALDMLDVNLALPEDVPIYLEFLSTPVGHFEVGHRRFRGRLEAIDYESRARHLRDVLPYSRVLQHGKT
jgi:hypothetical protein